MASSTVSVNGSAVGVPDGTLPRNGAGGSRVVKTGADCVLAVAPGGYCALTVVVIMTVVTNPPSITSTRLTDSPPLAS